MSDDKDYKSLLDKNEFNSFLLEEWINEKSSKLFFFNQLSEFFIAHHASIELKVEESKNELINELSNSDSFASTHQIISKLSEFDGFTDSQIVKLLDIAISNSQVYWISQDSEVKSFFESISKGKEDILYPESYRVYLKLYVNDKLGDVPFLITE